jgi:hypothetical protein
MLAAVALLALALAVVVLSIRLRSAHSREEALLAELQRIRARALLVEYQAVVEAQARAVEAEAIAAERARAASGAPKPGAEQAPGESR